MTKLFRLTLLLIAVAGLYDVWNDDNEGKRMDTLIMQSSDCDSVKQSAKKFGIEWSEFKKEWVRKPIVINNQTVVNNINTEPTLTKKQLNSVLDTVKKYFPHKDDANVSIALTPDSDGKEIYTQIKSMLNKNGYELNGTNADWGYPTSGALSFRYTGSDLIIVLDKFKR